MTAPTDLTDRQRMFVSEYLKDRNATQAAIRAGYSEKTANEQASRLLAKANIRRLVDDGLERLLASNDLSVDRILKELARVLYFDVGKLYDDSGAMKHPKDMDADTRAALASVEVIEAAGGDGKVATVTKKAKGYDKNAALRLAMQYRALLTDKVEHTGKDGADLMQPTDNEIARRVCFLLEKGMRSLNTTEKTS